MQFVERKTLVEELAHDGLFFYDDYVTLHHAKYHRDPRKLLLQCVSIKGKQVTDTCGS